MWGDADRILKTPGSSFSLLRFRAVCPWVMDGWMAPAVTRQLPGAGGGGGLLLSLAHQLQMQQLWWGSVDGPFQPPTATSGTAQRCISELRKTGLFVLVSQLELVPHGEQTMKNECSKNTLCPYPAMSLHAVWGKTRWLSILIYWKYWTNVKVPPTQSLFKFKREPQKMEILLKLQKSEKSRFFYLEGWQG